MQVSRLAQNIIGSEIIKLAAEVNEKIKKGERIFNLTIGDFDPREFPIPQELKQYIIEAYQADHTNYPSADGMLELRVAVSALLKQRANLAYAPDEILIAGGARPIIYSVFRALVDPDDLVFFATPSWNNNHYTYLNGARAVVAEAKPENNFMPSAADLAPHIGNVTFVALCSPQNPTGTVFTSEGMAEICDVILAENKKRAGTPRKPVYLMYDQIYWALTHDQTIHHEPVGLRPAMKEYTIYVDGISKSLSATGIRIGWCMGPKFIVDKMKAILTHVGAWAPKAEQIAAARYLSQLPLYDAYLSVQRTRINQRLDGFYKGIVQLRSEGFGVNAIPPQAAIYLTVQFNLRGRTTSKGHVLSDTRDVTRFLLDEARLAIVPFYAFGTSEESSWYRLSVGTCKLSDVDAVINNLRAALKTLK